MVAAQWIDLDSYGSVDLSLTSASDTAGLAESNLALANDGTGRFSRASMRTSASRSVEDGKSEITFGSTAVPTDWGDAEEEGSPDLLQLISISPQVARKATSGDGMLADDKGAALALLENNPYQSFAGPGTWEVANNGDNVEAHVTSACNCRFATHHLQERHGEAVDRSIENALFRSPVGKEAVWVDSYRDSALDLAPFVDARFRLFKHTLHEQSNHVSSIVATVVNVGLRHYYVTLVAGSDCLIGQVVGESHGMVYHGHQRRGYQLHPEMTQRIAPRSTGMQNQTTPSTKRRLSTRTCEEQRGPSSSVRCVQSARREKCNGSWVCL